MRVPRAAGLAIAAAAFVAACGGSPQGAAHHTTRPPAPAASAPASAPAPATPSPTPTPLPTQLTISGPLTATVQLPQSASTCSSIPGGFEAQIPFTSSGTSYEVDIQILDYTGPGTYQAPPEPVAVHTVGSASPSALYPMTSGTVTIGSTQQSGTIDGTLGGSTTGKLDGTWACG